VTTIPQMLRWIPRFGPWVGAPLFIAVGLAAPAWAEGNARTGGWLTRAWCESCHSGATGVASDSAPPLEAIARRSHEGEAWLRAWLSDPHPPMPNFTLSRSEIDDIVTYLRTLAGN
jgi:mono/diheme cytochrome c family protein